MKKSVVFVLLIIIIAVILIIIISFANNKIPANKGGGIEVNVGDHSSGEKTDYEEALVMLGEGNAWVAEVDYNEHCQSDYRYYDRGCYYDYDARYRPEGTIIDYDDLKGFNLTTSEVLNLCKMLAHKGESA